MNLKLEIQPDVSFWVHAQGAAVRHIGGMERMTLPAKTDLLASDASRDWANETLDRRVLAGFRQANDGARDFTLTLIDQFITEAGSQLDRIREARQRRDDSSLKATAHSLRGSSMTMGAGRLGALCAQIEQQVARNPGGIVTLDLMIEADREFVNVQNALAAERRGGSQR